MQRGDAAIATFSSRFPRVSTPARRHGLAASAARAACATFAAGMLAVLAGCAREAVVQPVLQQQCVRLGGIRQTVTVPVSVRGSGLLHIAVRERGISAAGEIAGSRQATSPIDRLGTITLVRDVRAPATVPVRVTSLDSHDIEGDVCISGALLTPSTSAEARAQALMAAADGWTAREEWQRAFDDYLAAARLFDTLGMGESAAGARHAMAELAYRYLQRRRDALALIATTFSDRTMDIPAIAGARLELMARILTDSSSPTEQPNRAAIGLLRAAAERFKSSTVAAREYPRLAIQEGYVDYRSGRSDEAERRFNEAAGKCKELRDSECFAQARMDIAAIAEERQSYAAALAAYEDALDSLDVSRMPKVGADIHYNLARLEGRVGLFRRSAADQDAAMRLYAQLGRCDLARLSASSLGEMLVEVGSVSDALVYLNRAATLDCSGLLAAARSMSETGDEAGGDTAGMAPSRMAGRESAFAACVRPPAVAGSTPDGDIAVFQALLGLAEIAKADDDLAIANTCETAARLYSVDARTQVRLLNARGALELELRKLAAARSTFAGALQVSEAASLADASEFRGIAEQGLAETAIAAGQLVQAKEHAVSALGLAVARADITQTVASLRLLASSDAAAGNTAQAARTLRSAIALLERVPIGELDPEQRATYLATQYAVFGELTDLLVPAAESSDGTAVWSAFEIAELGHARSLRYAVQLASRERAPLPVEAESLEYRGLLRSIAAISSSRSAEGHADLPRELDALTSRFARSEGTFDRGTLAAQLANMRAILVEYAAGHDDMYVFVTDGTRIHVVRLGSRAAIAQAATALMNRLRQPEPSAPRIRQAASDLARLVWWPVHPYLTGERIVIVPDDALHTIPFAVLPWTSESASGLVVQHVETSSIPSTLLLTRSTPAQSDFPGRPRVVLLGDPVFRVNLWLRNCAGSAASKLSPGELPPSLSSAFEWTRLLPSLPGTRAEVVSIAKVLGGWRRPHDVQTLLRCGATPDALREAAPGAMVIHVATHGLVDARRPRLSALALTPGFAGDPAFRLFDILQLHLHARMVVLSACDTSQGRLLPGEGVLGLAQAFLQAGSQSVIASYWRVEDAKVEPFMESFYRHLITDRLPLATALRRTQLEQASEQDSYDWAAFSLYGRPDSML